MKNVTLAPGAIAWMVGKVGTNYIVPFCLRGMCMTAVVESVGRLAVSKIPGNERAKITMSIAKGRRTSVFFKLMAGPYMA